MTLFVPTVLCSELGPNLPDGAERLRPLLRPVGAGRRLPRGARDAGGERPVNDFPWLSLIVLVPLLGAVATRFVPAGSGVGGSVSLLPKYVALATSVITFLL